MAQNMEETSVDETVGSKFALQKGVHTERFRGSIVVSIPACHAGNPGSIPGLGVFFLGCTKNFSRQEKNVEEQGIDPCASCMLSMRSTI